MTLEERSQLNRFLNLLTQAQAGPKDAEAEALIAEAVRRQPDATYLLVQRVLQLEHALLEATTRKASFVGDANAWGRAPAPVAPSQPPAQPTASTLQPSPAAPAAPQPAPAQPSAWGSGLFGTVASTAAGVVAGSLLAQGIGSLFGGHHSPSQAASLTPDALNVPPGGGSLVETDYNARAGNDDYVGDFDTRADASDSGDPSGGDSV